jgi:hypothetical protein
MEGPLIGAKRTQAIEGQIDTFADAHAGVTQKQEGVTQQIIAAPKFLLD